MEPVAAGVSYNDLEGDCYSDGGGGTPLFDFARDLGVEGTPVAVSSYGGDTHDPMVALYVVDTDEYGLSPEDIKENMSGDTLSVKRIETGITLREFIVDRTRFSMVMKRSGLSNVDMEYDPDDTEVN